MHNGNRSDNKRGVEFEHRKCLLKKGDEGESDKSWHIFSKFHRLLNSLLGTQGTIDSSREGNENASAR